MRLLFSDMDGTFLDDAKNVPAINMRALDAIARAGDAFVPCTGRIIDGVPAKVLEHPATRFVVSCNGACVFAREEDGSWALVNGWKMPWELAGDVCRSVKDCEAISEFFSEHEVVLREREFQRLDEFYGGTSFADYIRRTRRPCGELELQGNDISVFRMNIRAKTEREATRVQCVLERLEGLSLTRSVPEAVDVTAEGVGKAAAGSWLARHVGVPMAECVAFGDADNDRDLIEMVGTGVAVGNAEKTVLQSASCVTEANVDGGVGSYIFHMYQQEGGKQE